MITETRSPSLNARTRSRPTPYGNVESTEEMGLQSRGHGTVLVPITEGFAEGIVTKGSSEIHPRRFSLTTHRADTLALMAEFMETATELYGLRNLPPEDGYDSEAPELNTIEDAASWIVQMYWDALETGRGWHKPHVTADEDGDIMFEWWNEDKALTIYVSEDSVSYIKGRGLDIENEMEDGEATTSEIRQALWAWLIN